MSSGEGLVREQLRDQASAVATRELTVPGGTVFPSDGALLEAVLHRAPFAFAFYDADGRYRLLNKSLADINRVALEAHIGRKPAEVLPSGLARAIEANLAQVLDTGETVVDSALVEPPSGQAGPMHVESRWFPLHENEVVVGVAMIITDVTDRHQSEDALRRSTARTEALQRATAELATALTVDEVLRAIARVGRSSVGADYSGVAVLEDGELRYPSVEGQRLHNPDQWRSVPLTLPTMLTTAVKHRRALYVPNRAELLRLLPYEHMRDSLAGSQEQAWIVLPLISSGAPLGALRFAFRSEHHADADDQAFLAALAGQCALALERARLYEREHAAAVWLQRSLLPDRLPDLPGVRVSFRYFPGTDDVEVGGDWYDAFELPGGLLAAVVGDVIGKGLGAAAGMGRVRAALRALAYTDWTPASVLTGLDRLFSATELDESLTTLIYAVIDPSTGVVQAAEAGHLPLLVISAGGEPRPLKVKPGSTPLGVAERRSETTIQLAPGDTVLAFSDGLIENRARSIDDGLAELVETTRGRVTSLETLLDRVVVRLGDGQDCDDDVTVLGIQISGGSPPDEK